MALYAISDLHLPLGINKPMDIFGKKWENYVERLEENWQNVVGQEDTVVLAGDFSWATYLEESEKDFDFINRLNGRKILLKGNHDYWWTTMNKLKVFVEKNQWENIYFLQNNSFEYKDISICGTRGWNTPQGAMSEEDRKIYLREIQRMELSIKSAKNPDNIIAFTHYPPILRDYRQNEMTQLFKMYNISRCIFGHIHSTGVRNVYEGFDGGTEYTLISADYREFMPVKLAD